MFSKIGHFFKKLWDAIRKVLAIILIIIAIILICFATFGTGLLVIPFIGIALTPTMALLAGILALTCAFIVDADTSTEVVGKIGEAVGDAASAVGGAAGDIAGGLFTGVLSSTGGMLLLGGLGLYFLLSGSEGGGNAAPVEDGKKVVGIEGRRKDDEPVVARRGDDYGTVITA